MSFSFCTEMAVLEKVLRYFLNNGRFQNIWYIFLMTRQIVEAAFEVLAKFDAIEALKLVLEVEIPNMTLILNTIGQDSLKVDEACKIKYTLE